ncbi:septum site-determining protein MinC [bacterium]|nr:septum site-determining protein MinC [bacterium]
MDNGFIEDGFIINLSNASSAAEVIYELSSILEMPEAQGKKICLKLEKIDLTQSQLLSIKALIESMDSTLEFVDTKSDATKEVAQALEITISELKNEMEIPQIQPSEEELQQFTAKPDLFDENVNDFAFQELAQEEGLMKPDDMKPYATMDEDETPDLDLEDDDEDVEKLPTLYVNQTLRSGQTVSSEGNIVIIGDANPGSEIIARGDVTVWGVLGGIAHAGSKGNVNACIRALKMNAIQLRIANLYARRVNTENIPFVQKSSSFIPEEARVDGKSIVIKTTYESKEK